MEVVRDLTTLKDKPEFYLQNTTEDGNPVIRALVQTPREIDYGDVGGGRYEYTEEAIRNAIGGLVGYQVEDEQHDGTSDKSFATVVNSGYCPDYGGYVDVEVFKPEYFDVVKNIAKNIENGILPKKRFSTEVKVKNALPKGDNRYKITDMFYDGLIWTKKPRDQDTGICSVKLNKKSTEPFRSENMTDEKLKQLEKDYTELKTKYGKLEEDYTNGGTAYKALSTKYKDGKQLYEKAKDEIEDLTGQLKPIWEAEETERVEMLNKIVENADEDSQKVLRKSLENQSKDELTVLYNGIKPAGKGAVRKPKKKTATDDEPTVDEVLKAFGRIK